MRFVWTPESVDRLNALAAQGMSAPKIGAALGCTTKAVYKKVGRLRIKLRGYGRGRPLREPFIDSGVGKIPLSKGLVAIIDIDDIPLVSGRNWWAGERTKGAYYASTCPAKGEPTIHLHRFLTNTPMHLCVDHKDGDPLNNRRENLRVCTYQQNSFNSRIPSNNTSGKAGVQRIKKGWNARIQANGKYIHLGDFSRFEDAVAARLAAEKEYFGEFARVELGEHYLSLQPQPNERDKKDGKANPILVQQIEGI